MLARHPSTGQPIRILRTERQVTADHKTLVWVRDTFAPSHRWAQRWYAVVDTVDAAVRVCMGHPCAAIYISNVTDDWVTHFSTLFQDPATLLVCSSDVLRELETRGCVWKHTILTDILTDIYPQIGKHAPSTPTEYMVAIAHILRANRIVWSAELEDTHPLLVAWKKACAAESNPVTLLAAHATDSCIPRVWLIQQYYRPPQARRARELQTALERNIACDWIDHILLLNEEVYSDLPPSPKVIQTQLLSRMTYYDTLCAIRRYVQVGDYACFSNSDISFDSSLRHIWHIGLREHRLFLALLRWEESTGALFGPRPDSQDTWILARDCLDFEIKDADFGFPYGKSGCDNALTVAMLRHRFVIANPAYSIRTHHHHASNVRTYDPRDILYRPHYMYVDPVRIEPLAPAPVSTDTTLSADLPIRVAMEWVRCTRRTASFPRPILGVRDTDVREFCDAAQPWKFDPTDSNLWTPPPATSFVRHYKDGAFVNVTGSVWNAKTVLHGPPPPAQCLLPQTQSIHVPHLIATSAEQTMSINKWCLEYLPRALAIRDTLARAHMRVPEFLVPRLDMIGAFLADCVWNTDDNNTIIVTPMMDNVTYYSKDVWVAPSTSPHITKEDVNRLRSCLPLTPRLKDTTHIVLCVEEDDDPGAILTRTCAEYIAAHALKPEWTVHYVRKQDTPTVRRKAFAAADWILGSGSALDWIWYAPKQATVMEFVRRGSSHMDGSIAHLAGAAEQRYIVCSAEPGKHVECAADVSRALSLYGFKHVLETLRLRGAKTPTVIVPAGAALTGIHAHAGDTFREMVEIWKERNYVNVTYSETTPYCWWGGIGEILLYDRPTTRWWTNPPPVCQMALFGNCAPPGPEEYIRRQSVWSFWPRSPRAVEQIVSQGLNRKGYMTRTIESVFLGKIENGIQHVHRTGADWKSAVTLFSMPVDTTGAPYPYTQEAYLETLCASRYGLCLRGFGPKCNREIEYFACGCVPIVTPDVDMKHYLVPPVEDVHYVVAKTPEDVRRIVADTKPERWARMSAAGREWWRAYASAEGMFRLTWARIEQCRPYFAVGIPHAFI